MIQFCEKKVDRSQTVIAWSTNEADGVTDGYTHTRARTPTPTYTHKTARSHTHTCTHSYESDIQCVAFHTNKLFNVAYILKSVHQNILKKNFADVFKCRTFSLLVSQHLHSKSNPSAFNEQIFTMSIQSADTSRHKIKRCLKKQQTFAKNPLSTSF